MSDGPGERDEKEEASGDPLRLVLHTIEEQLDDRVDAVSDRGPSHNESTSDLIRLEETLSSAQDKAKQLVTLRLKLDEEATASDAASGAGESTAGERTAGERTAGERTARGATSHGSDSRGDDTGAAETARGAPPSDAAPSAIDRNSST